MVFGSPKFRSILKSSSMKWCFDWVLKRPLKHHGHHPQDPCPPKSESVQIPSYICPDE